MIKIILVGFWACLTTLAAGYAMSHLREAAPKPPVAAAASPRELKKTKEINVPKIRDGVVKGYIVAQLSYVVDPAARQEESVAARRLSSSTRRFATSTTTTAIDFDHLDTFDLNKMTKALIKNVNARLNADVVVDMGIQEFTFLTSAQAKQRQ